MRVYSFSIRPKQQADTELVEALKKYCDDSGVLFSKLVIDGLRKLNEEKGYVKQRG